MTDKALEAALPGEAEVVGIVNELRQWAGNPHMLASGEPVLSRAADALQAMQARAEKAERERDAFRDMADGYGKLDAELAISEARVKELEEAMEPFSFKGLRVDLDRFDEETGIDVHFPRTSPRKAIPVARIYVEDVLRARTVLKGGSNG